MKLANMELYGNDGGLSEYSEYSNFNNYQKMS